MSPSELVPLFIFMAVQTGALVWWAATVTAKLGFVVTQVHEAVQTIKTLASSKDVEIVHLRIDRLDSKVEERLKTLETMVTQSGSSHKEKDAHR